MLGSRLSIGIPLFGLPPLVLFAVILHDLYNCRWVICDEYVIQIQGLFQFNVNTRRIHFIHIRGVEIDHKFYQRFVNVGDIKLGGIVGIEPAQVVMYGVANPREVKHILHRRINRQLTKVAFVPQGIP